MSILTNNMVEFAVLDKVTELDGYGGETSSYSTKTLITGAMYQNSSIETTTTQALDARSTYSLLIPKKYELKFHDVIKRTDDEKIFRVISDSELFTPQTAGLELRKITIEEWSLVT